MSEILALPALADPPDRRTVLASQGIPARAKLTEGVERVVEAALKLYPALTDPRGICTEVSQPEFAALYRGEGLNADRTPLENIFPRAERLALFVVSLGEALSRRIGELFDQNEPALAHMLDAIASERADLGAELGGRHFLERLVSRGQVAPSTRVLAYSPGYCGWHITGQRKLFERLKPERIGVTLNASCLMQPLKSVSGVWVAGAGEIHSFDNDFDFCDGCATHPCRERIASVSTDGTGREPRGDLEWRS